MAHGWIRLLRFYPEQNIIRFEAYSPVLNTVQRDDIIPFDIHCDLLMP